MTQETDESFVLVKFSGVGSAVLDVAFNNVTPLQILAATAYLEVRAKNELVRQENARMAREAEQSIARPNQGIVVATK